MDLATPFADDPRTPDDCDGLPRRFPGPHPEAVGSRGDHAAEWIEARMRGAGGRYGGLRWWQWLVLQRLLEHRADGSWAWPVSFVSVSRQQGKTILLGELACYLCATAEQPIELAHAANTAVISRKHQTQWVPWARSLDLTIRSSLADSQIGWPDGSVWRTVAANNMWGRTLDVAMLDEVWAWTDDQFWAGVYPTMVERERALAVCMSAANDSDRGLVASLRSDETVLCMEWGAEPTDDRADPATWRKASALWTPARERAMAVASTKPGFDTNWLNIWPERGQGRWVPVGATAAAGRARVLRNPPETASCAIECSLDGKRWAVAAAWATRRGVTARVWEADTLERCTMIAGARGTWAHAAVVERQDVTARWHMRPVSGAQHRAATGMLREALITGRLHLAGVDDATWDHVRTTPADGGEIIDAKRSTGDVHAVKALAWAVWAVQSQGNLEFVL